MFVGGGRGLWDGRRIIMFENVVCGFFGFAGMLLFSLDRSTDGGM